MRLYIIFKMWVMHARTLKSLSSHPCVISSKQPHISRHHNGDVYFFFFFVSIDCIILDNIDVTQWPQLNVNEYVKAYEKNPHSNVSENSLLTMCDYSANRGKLRLIRTYGILIDGGVVSVSVRMLLYKTR